MGLDMCNGNITGLESASGSVTYNDNKPWYCAVGYTDWKSSSTKICRFFTVNYPTTWKFYWKSLDSTEFLPALPNRWLFLVYLSFIYSSNNTVSKIAQVIEKSWYEGGPFFVILLYESINYRWCPLKKAAKNPRVWKDVNHSTVEFFSKPIFLSGRNCNGTTWIHLPWKDCKIL